MRLGLVLRLAWRDWRSGELGLLLAALLVAVGSVTAVSLLVDRLQQALVAESAEFLAADRYIGSSRAIPDSFREAARELNLDIADTLSFPSMVFAGDERNQLVSVKAVTAGYPLRGTLIVADRPFTRGQPTDELPAPGEVWLDSRLFPALDVELGDTVEVGMAELTISRVLVTEPDRGGGMFDLGPRLLMHMTDVPATEVVQPGSRLSYRLLLRGPDAALETLRESLTLEPNFRWRGIRDSSQAIGAALDRAESFLLLGGLLGVLLAGVAVALSAHRYARRHYDHVAILKTLGAGPGQILRAFIVLLSVVGAVAVVLGLLLGSGLHAAMVAVLMGIMPVSLPMPTVRPFLLGGATGFICALAFALPPLLHLYNISPMRVIRRDLGSAPPSQIVSYAAAGAGSLGLLLWYSNSLWLTLWTLGCSAAVLVGFSAMALGLLRGGRALGMQAGSGWRLALAGLQRRRRENVAQILIFGLAIMLLLILVLLRTALLDEWRNQVPEDAPNHFVLNVTPDQVDELSAMLAEVSDNRGGLYPLVRGRIVAVGDVDAETWEDRQRAAGDDVGDGPSLTSERNLTWMRELPGDNRVVRGEWWSDAAGSADRALVSLEDDYAEDRGLSVGDILTFDIAGREVVAEVANLRRLDWESMRPNFFIIFSPGVLEDYPATYMTSFHLDSEQKPFLNRLLSRFPTVTVIEVDALIRQIQSIISRVTQAVELVLGLVLAAGCLVLVASIQASRDARMHEHALIRALGGTRRLIAGSLAAEFAILGLFAGVVAVVGAEVTVAVLQSQIFEMGADIHPWLWLLGPLTGAVLILAVGLAGTRSLISTPPMLVLRGLN
ncbi:MAG: FtsX-like permease family protein [Gammaproteobacteria bacterium]|nr:FtsX-like permease family protein [Gammaproteobacteria bacterium]